MTTIQLLGDTSILEGFAAIRNLLDLRQGTEGIMVEAEKTAGALLEVKGNSGKYRIRFSEKVFFFRGLGLLCQELEKGNRDIAITEIPRFTMDGAMYDVSQGNAVMRVSTVKELLRRMSLMGLNMLMLYVEDSYDLKDNPYFGYMRSRYSPEELKDLDDFAWSLGIEMIPCIQTLAHLIDVLKWEVYQDIREDDDTLLVGEEKTYRFVEQMITRSAAPFRTKRMHIGMDEAWKLGQGQYLLKNGYRSKFDIMNEHLARVAEICRKKGIRAMIWSDMYFRAASPTGDYYDISAPVPPEVSAAAPPGIQMVYWDYYHDTADFYREWLKRHRAFPGGTVFAGGMWNWTGFGMNWGKTFKNTNAALRACKESGCKEVFMTVWGDDTTESSVYTTLLGLQLYAEHNFRDEIDLKSFRERASFCTGMDCENLEALSRLNEIPGTEEGNPQNFNAAKILIWQDPLAGLFDYEIREVELTGHYAGWAAYYEEAAGGKDPYGLFAFSARIARVLELKADLGKKITAAYKAGDKSALRFLAETAIPGLIRRTEELRRFNRDYWMAHIKPLGWEVLDLRYGALLARLDTAAYRIKSWLAGKTSVIEELEETRLPFSSRGLSECNCYGRFAMSGRISASISYRF
ncbi:MAG: beta-N-acetylhexosaminidase [Spirochaetaceae bacterium]|jgi:hypothetical protein|nr:beta-N-acetylhexosaminidase [Spirochaetaceae bacterium]